MESGACLQVRAMCHSPSEKVRKMALAMMSSDRTPESMVIAFHECFGAPVRETPTDLPIVDVDRRLRLSLEEYLETVKASGFTIVSKTTGEDIFKDLKLQPVEGALQDHAEIADGDADQVVVAIGHAIEHGFPFMAVFNEAMFSNATKMPEDGIPILNRCIAQDTNSSHVCESHGNDCVLLDPTAPVNKILKPASYVKADISGILSGKIKEDTSLNALILQPEEV